MKKRRWWLRIILPVVVLIIVIIIGGYFYLFRQSFPKTRGKVTLDGLKAPVEILRDKYGVPHIYARSAEDLFFAQGYVHAQDRFWQMEFNRRVGTGRLSELFGKKLLDADIYLRTMGYQHVSEEEYRLLDGETKRYLDSYTAGVNAYIGDRKPRKLGLEFSLLKLQGTDIDIEDWKPTDSLVWAKVMAQSLCANLDSEPIPFDIIRMAGLDKLNDYLAPYRKDMPFIVNDEELGIHATGELASRDPGIYSGEEGTKTGFPLFLGNRYALGSNCWVLSGDLTKTGKPILANDVHLGIQMPSPWYEIGLHTIDEEGELTDSSSGDFQVRGFSLPGYPGVIVGHNSLIAWGMTLSYYDVQDLYFEKINPENPYQYEVNGTWKDMEVRYERIDIEGEEDPYILVVRKTRHGPIVSDLAAFSELVSFYLASDKEFPDNVNITELSLQWTAFYPGQILKTVFLLDRAQSFPEFQKALRYWDAPSVSFVYADVAGNIGYQAPGVVPIRAKGLGQVPAAGWTDGYEWIGFVPYEDLPSLYNPEKGYIVTANNPVTGPLYPYFLSTDFSYGYRARRIVEMIEENKDGISIQDVKVMQSDSFDQTASEIVPYLKNLDFTTEVVSEYLKEKEPKSEEERKEREEEEKEIMEGLEIARQSLFEWNFRMEMESPQAALFNFFLLKLLEETFRDQYPDALLMSGLGGLVNALFYLLEDPDNFWWDDIRTPDVKETRDDMIIRAFKKGYRACRERLGDEYDFWEWGDVHQAEFRNQTLGESGIKPVERLFNRGPVATGGGSMQVNRASWDVEEPFKVRTISSLRQIIDLGTLEAGLMILAPGQSGHPKHRHYDDMIEPWRLIEYHPSLWKRSDLEDQLKDRLILQPASSD